MGREAGTFSSYGLGVTSFFNGLKRYVGFGPDDSAALLALEPHAAEHLVEFAERFYHQIDAHPDARSVLSGPDQVERLKKTLVEWMRSGLVGPHDETYYQRRANIGRVHVRIELPQQYMFTAMNLIRRDFHHLVNEVIEAADSAQATHDALDKLYDLELAIMLQTFREDSDDRLRRVERLATIGQIAAGIGHDLRNPLGVIQSSMYLVRRRTGDEPKVMRHIERIEKQVDLCDDIIRNLLELARNQPPRRESIEIIELFRRVLEAAHVPDRITIEQTIEDGLVIKADGGLLRQALVNLVNNAIQAHNGDSGTIYLTATRVEGDVMFEVADDGPGFDAETITRVFEPLVTTRKSGTGLGLALVKGVAERHGGTVEAANRPEGGAAVRLRLPPAEEASRE